ncbi:MAG: hypothetical protein ACXWMW_09285 [Syntrophales bacterium]
MHEVKIQCPSSGRVRFYAEGLRFRLPRKDLSDYPDIVLSRIHVIIFVHGGFGISIQNVD